MRGFMIMIMIMIVQGLISSPLLGVPRHCMCIPDELYDKFGKTFIYIKRCLLGLQQPFC